MSNVDYIITFGVIGIPLAFGLAVMLIDWRSRGRVDDAVLLFTAAILLGGIAFVIGYLVSIAVHS